MFSITVIVQGVKTRIKQVILSNSNTDLVCLCYGAELGASEHASVGVDKHCHVNSGLFTVPKLN